MGKEVSFEQRMEEIEIEENILPFPWATWTMQFAPQKRKTLIVSYQVSF